MKCEKKRKKIKMRPCCLGTLEVPLWEDGTKYLVHACLGFGLLSSKAQCPEVLMNRLRVPYWPKSLQKVASLAKQGCQTPQLPELDFTLSHLQISLTSSHLSSQRYPFFGGSPHSLMSNLGSQITQDWLTFCRAIAFEPNKPWLDRLLTQDDLPGDR